MSPVYIAAHTCIGDHVQLMPMSCIGHDVVVKDFTTICPGCTVSGYVVVEEDVFLGAGSTIVNGRPDGPLVVGKGAMISAGSVVTKTVPPGAKVAGNPARVRVVQIHPAATYEDVIEGLKHMETAIVPGIFDPGLLDEKLLASTDEAYEVARMLAREEGMFLGQSCGAVMWAGRILRHLRGV